MNNRDWLKALEMDDRIVKLTEAQQSPRVRTLFNFDQVLSIDKAKHQFKHLTEILKKGGKHARRHQP